MSNYDLKQQAQRHHVVQMINQNDRTYDEIVSLTIDGWNFIAQHEAEYLSGNEFVMLKRLRDFLFEQSDCDDKSVISSIAHELLKKFQAQQLQKTGLEQYEKEFQCTFQES